MVGAILGDIIGPRFEGVNGSPYDSLNQKSLNFLQRTVEQLTTAL